MAEQTGAKRGLQFTGVTGTIFLAVIAGVCLGALSLAGDFLPEKLQWIANMAAPWVAVAFLLGANRRKALVGALAAAAALVIAAVVYFALEEYFLKRGIPIFRGADEQIWVVVAAIAGAAFGLLGATWREGGRTRSVVAGGLMSGFLVAEALVLLMRRGGSGDFIFGVEIAVGAMLPWVLFKNGRDRSWAVLIAAGVAVAAFVLRVAVLGAFETVD
ncbi:MAG: DUF6518 family protein [Actinomycetota bacterium]